jgi:hypothetical protein
MKMKKLKIVILSTSLLFAVMAFGQNDHRYHHRMMHLDSVLELTSEQKQQIKELHNRYQEDYRELRDKGKTLRKEEMKAMQEILTAEQSKKLEALKLQKRKEIKSARNAKRAYVQEHIEPALKEYRLQLENVLTSDEKERIQSARTIKEVLRKTVREARESGQPMSEEVRASLNQKRQEMEALLEPIIENHRAFFEEMKDAMEDHKNHFEGNTAEKQRTKRRKQAQHKPGGLYRFLLIEV